MNALLSIWTWIEVGLVALVGFFVQPSLAISPGLFDKRRYVAGRCFRLVGVTAAKLTPFWRFGMHGPIPPGGAQHRGGEQPRVQRGPLPHLPPAVGDEVAGQGLALQDSRGGLDDADGRRHPA